MTQQTASRLFETEDLPLFSGAAPRAAVTRLDLVEHFRQARLDFAACPICLDTGRVIVRHGQPARFCWCNAGAAERTRTR